MEEITRIDLVIIGSLFIAFTALVVFSAAFVMFGRRLLTVVDNFVQSTPTKLDDAVWADLRPQLKARAEEGAQTVETIVTKSPNKIDDELWTELKPRLRGLIDEVFGETLAAATKNTDPAAPPVDVKKTTIDIYG
jgi:hypothetical protein